MMDSDPTALTGAPRTERKLPAHLDITEMDRLLAVQDLSTVAGRRDHAILELLYASGLRLSEIFNVDLDDINLRGRIVRVQGKGGKERLVPFNAKTAEALRQMIGDRTNFPTVVEATKGDKLRARSRNRSHCSQPAGAD
jgi:site-specific recombinase XerD